MGDAYKYADLMVAEVVSFNSSSLKKETKDKANAELLKYIEKKIKQRKG